MNEEEIKNYLTDHLLINIKEESYGFNGKLMTFELKIDDEVISSDSIILEQDKG